MNPKFNQFTDTVRVIGTTIEMKIIETGKEFTSSQGIDFRYTGKYKCAWNDENGNYLTKTFNDDELELVKREPLI